MLLCNMPSTGLAHLCFYFVVVCLFVCFFTRWLRLVRKARIYRQHTAASAAMLRSVCATQRLISVPCSFARRALSAASGASSSPARAGAAGKSPSWLAGRAPSAEDIPHGTFGAWYYSALRSETSRSRDAVAAPAQDERLTGAWWGLRSCRRGRQHKFSLCVN